MCGESLELSTIPTWGESVFQTNCNEFHQWDGIAEDDDVDDDSIEFPWDPGRALSTESEAGALGIFDGTWQDGSEDVAQFWHDDVEPDSSKISPAEGKSSVLSSASDETRTRKFLVSSEIRPGSARRQALLKESAAPVKEFAGSVKELAAHVQNQLLVFHEFLFVPKRNFVSADGQKMLGTPHVRTSWWALLRQPTSVSRSRCQVPLSGVSAGTSVSKVVAVPADHSPLRHCRRATVQRRVCPW